jgi:hypothetical protein
LFGGNGARIDPKAARNAMPSTSTMAMRPVGSRQSDLIMIRSPVTTTG